MIDSSSTHLPQTDRPRVVTAPVALIAPGALLVFVGLWVVTDGGPHPFGWACVALGLALLLPGAVAQGVAWGLALHESRRD